MVFQNQTTGKMVKKNWVKIPVVRHFEQLLKIIFYPGISQNYMIGATIQAYILSIGQLGFKAKRLESMDELP